MKKKLRIVFFILFFVSLIFLLMGFIKIKSEEKVEKRNINEKIEDSNHYFGILDIPKIELKKEIYEIKDERNNIKKNILVHNKSVFPENESSMIILAAHSGAGHNAYFKNLYLLNIGDIVNLYYQNKIYTYEIINIEEQEKTGILYLKENKEDTLILITCTYHNRKTQTILYAICKNIQNISEFS